MERCCCPGSHHPSPSLDATKEEDIRRSRRPARRPRRRVQPGGRSWRDPPRRRAVAMMPKESNASSNARANGSTRISRFVIVCGLAAYGCTWERSWGLGDAGPSSMTSENSKHTNSLAVPLLEDLKGVGLPMLLIRDWSV